MGCRASITTTATEAYQWSLVTRGLSGRGYTGAAPMGPSRRPLKAPFRAALHTQRGPLEGDGLSFRKFFFGADFKTKRLKSQKKFSDKF